MTKKYHHHIWITIHSASLVAELSEKELIIVNKKNGETQTNQCKKGDFEKIRPDEAWMSNIQYAKRRGIAMVIVGFIVEGTSDFIILKSDKFQNLLKYELEIETNESLINIVRSRSRLKKNFVPLVRNLQKQNVDYIFILVDQDNKEKQRKYRGYKTPDYPIVIVNEIQNFRDKRNYIFEENSFVIMTRDMEAWFLADANLKLNYEGQPEEILNPSDIVGEQLGTYQVM